MVGRSSDLAGGRNCGHAGWFGSLTQQRVLFGNGLN